MLLLLLGGRGWLLPPWKALLLLLLSLLLLLGLHNRRRMAKLQLLRHVVLMAELRQALLLLVLVLLLLRVQLMQVLLMLLLVLVKLVQLLIMLLRQQMWEVLAGHRPQAGPVGEEGRGRDGRCRVSDGWCGTGAIRDKAAGIRLLCKARQKRTLIRCSARGRSCAVM